MAIDKQQLLIELRAKGVTLTKGQLKQLDAQVKASRAGMVAMGAAIAGATIALVALGKTLSHSIRVGKEFEQSMANLKAILRPTSGEMMKLDKTARQLGASTKFTASQVGSLQTEFAKLGFSVKEIDGATSATLSLAAAVGADLQTSAAVAGQTLRAFGMDASDTHIITDTMAESFSRSALDMAKFTDSMSYVAPVAKMAGFEVKGTTALLGTLANAGIHGSMAGTSLRRVFLELSNENSKLAQRLGGSISSIDELVPALEKLREEGVSTAEMKDLVGLRAVSAFNILLEGTETIDGLTESLENAGGAAEAMANVQLDTLEGKLTILNSAWEGFGVAIYDYMSEPLQGAVESLTGFIQSMTASIEIPFSEKMADNRYEALAYIKAMNDTNLSMEQQERVAKELALKFPEISDEYKTLKDEGKDLDEIIQDVSKSLMNQIIIQQSQEELESVIENQGKAWTQQYDATIKQEEALMRMKEALGININENISLSEVLRLANSEMYKGSNIMNSGNTILSSSGRKMEKLINAYNKQSSAVKQATEEYGEQSDEVKKLEERLESIRKTLGLITETDTTIDVSGSGDDGGSSDGSGSGAGEAESTLASRRLEWSEQRIESIYKEVEAQVFQLEQTKDIATEATEAQIDEMAKKLDAGMAMDEALKEVFGYEKINPFITAEEAQALMDNYKAIEEEYATTKLEAELEMYDQRVADLETFLDQQVTLEIMSTTEAESQKEKIRQTYEKKKRQATFQSFSAGLSMMSADLNAAAEAGIVSQKTAKKVAVVNTMIKTYESATNAFNAMAGIPFVGPALGAAAAAAAIASGMAQVQAIQGQQEEKPEAANVEKYISAGKAAAKAEKGGLIGGKPHSLGGTMIEAEKGEFIIKKSIVDKYGAQYFHSINETNQSNPYFQEGGLVDLGEDVAGDVPSAPVNIVFEGNVMSRDFVEGDVVEILQNYIRRGGEL